MRHKVYGKHLGRNKNQRTALFKSLVSSLILSEKIQTTESKAKAIKPLVDKLITQAKSESNKRAIFSYIPQKKVAQKLVDDILPRTANRTSGYTSTVRLGQRLGDGAMMVSISLLLEEAKASAKPAKAAKEEKKTEEVKAEVKVDAKKSGAPAKKAATPAKKEKKA